MATRNIDNVYKRKKYKDAQYGDKKSRTDDYTGERVFKGNDQTSLYKHPITKTSDTDHITPITVVEKRYPGLTEDQKKVLVNNEKHNYATTNSKLNRSKGGLENHEYLIRQIKKGEPENLKTSTQMIAKEIDSRIHMDMAATGMYIQNVADSTKDIIKTATTGAGNALATSAIPLALLAIQNLVAVANKEKTFSEAAKDVGAMEASVALTGGTTQIAFRLFAKPAQDYELVHMERIGHISQIGNVVIVANLIARTTARYIDGNISAEDFLSDIGQEAIGMVSGILAHKLFLMCALPGSTLASMITCAVCTEIHSRAKELLQERNDNQEIQRIADTASAELKKQQEELRRLMEANHSKWEEEMNEIFQEIAMGLVQQNTQITNHNLRKFAQKVSLYETGEACCDALLRNRNGEMSLYLLSGNE